MLLLFSSRKPVIMYVHSALTFSMDQPHVSADDEQSAITSPDRRIHIGDDLIFEVIRLHVTLNGDVKNQFVEANVSFNTVCKTENGGFEYLIRQKSMMMLSVNQM
ncbi:hypothetical protein L1987_31162 [Smallanthus sonchifolius]|uniref:Uncharacterized protein n=1 Tax=Smallanthus sonchifolius TaxID=185202 RepID=A0ACB9I4T2_9ASTR|nr:hypothetical protein L1987_31162 [Smallanthus sonchifolius]